MNENNNMTWTSHEFVKNLTKQLVDLCTSRRMLGGELYDIPELDAAWKTSAPEYMANAVPEIPHYPTVAIAWACYFGMGAAALWDTSWEKVKDVPDLYTYIRDVRGFDAMDDYVVEGLMDMHSNDNAADKINVGKLTTLIQDCAEIALTMIRKEGIEPQSINAFHMFAKTTQLMYRLGVSLALFGFGYKYVKADLN